VRASSKIILVLAATTAALAGILIVYIQSLTIFREEWSRNEVARVSSPTGRSDAVVYELNGGAATSFAYEVVVVRSGRTPSKDAPAVASFYGATRSPSAYGINIRWEDDKALIVEYLDAQMAQINKPVVEIDGVSVAVMLRSGVSDPTAPPGGMLNSLRTLDRSRSRS